LSTAPAPCSRLRTLGAMDRRRRQLTDLTLPPQPRPPRGLFSATAAPSTANLPSPLVAPSAPLCSPNFSQSSLVPVQQDAVLARLPLPRRLGRRLLGHLPDCIRRALPPLVSPSPSLLTEAPEMDLQWPEHGTYAYLPERLLFTRSFSLVQVESR
jgi:hypothetical protein